MISQIDSQRVQNSVYTNHFMPKGDKTFRHYMLVTIFSKSWNDMYKVNEFYLRAKTDLPSV